MTADNIPLGASTSVPPTLDASRSDSGAHDVTQTWLDVFERHLSLDGEDDSPTRAGDEPRERAPSTDGDADTLGRLWLHVGDDGDRLLDHREFRPELPAPAEPGSSTESAQAEERRRASAVSAFADQIAAAASPEERAFEEEQLEHALGRLEGREGPSTLEERQQIISQRMAFRAGGPATD